MRTKGSGKNLDYVFRCAVEMNLETGGKGEYREVVVVFLFMLVHPFGARLSFSATSVSSLVDCSFCTDTYREVGSNGARRDSRVETNQVH